MYNFDEIPLEERELLDAIAEAMLEGILSKIEKEATDGAEEIYSLS